MDMRLRFELLERTEEEIRSEMASSLGRIAATFESLLQELRALEPVAESSKDPEFKRKHRKVLDDARLYYWYLIVQRESIGLRDHRAIRREYNIPHSVLRR